MLQACPTNQTLEPSHVARRYCEYNPTIDKISGSVLLLCLCLGSVGNILAFIYFNKVPKKTLAEKIYTAISGLDFCTSISQLPVMLSLLSNREPILFNNQIFCAAWIVVFEYLQRISIYLVMLLSVSRTIAIVRPFFNVLQIAVLLSIIPYSLILLADVVIGLIYYEQAFFQFVDYGYPIKAFKPPYNATRHEAFSKVQNIAHEVEVMAPSTIVIISFVVSLAKMQMVDPQIAASQQNIRRASVTITLFTFMFIILNLPFFLTLALLIYDEYANPGKIASPLFSGWFMYHHSFVISKVVFVSLNAALNPILYFFRINRFRTWIKSLGSCKKIQVNFAETLAYLGKSAEQGNINKGVTYEQGNIRGLPRTSTGEKKSQLRKTAATSHTNKI